MPYPEMHEWHRGGYGSGHWLVALLLVALIGVAIFALVRFTQAQKTQSSKQLQPPGAPATPGPEDILRMRLAKGEIDVDEYRSKMAALTSSTPA